MTCGVRRKLLFPRTFFEIAQARSGQELQVDKMKLSRYVQRLLGLCVLATLVLIATAYIYESDIADCNCDHCVSAIEGGRSSATDYIACATVPPNCRTTVLLHQCKVHFRSGMSCEDLVLHGIVPRQWLYSGKTANCNNQFNPDYGPEFAELRVAPSSPSLDNLTVSICIRLPKDGHAMPRLPSSNLWSHADVRSISVLYCRRSPFSAWPLSSCAEGFGIDTSPTWECLFSGDASVLLESSPMRIAISRLKGDRGTL